MLTVSHSHRTMKRSLHNFPLHDAVENADVEKVAKILKTDIIPVQSKNDSGEWPLHIAAKKWSENKWYPVKILRLLHEYGACYLYKTPKNESALSYVAVASHTYTYYSITDQRDDQSIRIESVRQSLRGRGFGYKKEFKQYSAEFKAKVAYESISTQRPLNEIAKKHGVEEWEIVKWRMRVRESFSSLFEENKS